MWQWCSSAGGWTQRGSSSAEAWAQGARHLCCVVCGVVLCCEGCSGYGKPSDQAQHNAGANIWLVTTETTSLSSNHTSGHTYLGTCCRLVGSRSRGKTCPQQHPRAPTASCVQQQHTHTHMTPRRMIAGQTRQQQHGLKLCVTSMP